VGVELWYINKQCKKEKKNTGAGAQNISLYFLLNNKLKNIEKRVQELSTMRGSQIKNDPT